MKLKKLYIENIASIAKAEINFDEAPLADERLFLISGETGSGKSTIIDCICLALYGSTPRLKAISSKGSYVVGQNNDQDVEMTITDPRQLLRRGATEANIKLTFDDNNGIPYDATWHVHRAHNNPNGNFMGVVRMLETEEGVTPHKSYKNSAANAPIKEIVGLDMDQFFRTVVLAQGKFAEFLDSAEKDKATLLEKMTGTEIYSRISEKIFAMRGEKKEAYELLKARLEGITMLSEEEKEEIKTEIQKFEKNRTEAQETIDKAKAMSKWLEDKTKNEADLAGKREELSKQQAKTKEQDYIGKQHLVRDWDATNDARHNLSAKQKAEANLVRLDKEKDGLQHEFDRLCSGLRTAQADVDAKQSVLAETTAFIKQEESNKEMYVELGRIKVLLENRKTAENNITDFGNALKRDEENLPKREQALKDAAEAQQQTDVAVKKLQAEHEALNVEQVNAAIHELNAAKSALEVLKAKNDAVADAQTVIARLQDDQKKAQSELDKENAAIEGKREVLKQAGDAVERQRDWNALLEKAHKTLHEGDTCPVCGNVIKNLLDEKGESELATLQNKKKDAEDIVRQAEASIKANEKRLAEAERKRQDEERNLTSKTEEREMQWEKAQTALAQCGKAETDMPANARIDELISGIDTEIDFKSKIQTRANDLHNQLQDANGKKSKAKDEFNAALRARDEALKSIENQKRTIADNKNKFDELTCELNSLLVIKDWQQREDRFIDELERAAQKYNEQAKAEDALSNDIKTRLDAIQRMQQAKDGIQGFVDNNLPAFDIIPDGLEQMWNTFVAKTVKWNTDLENEKKAIAEAQHVLDLFFEQGAMDITHLQAIASHSQIEIDGIKEEQNAVTQAISTLMGKVDTLEHQKKELAEKKPDYSEEDREKLTEIIAFNQVKFETSNTEISMRMARLSQDADNQARLGELTSQCVAAETVYQRWDALNNMLGSADGSKFKRIAQSYILGDLLGSANEYLRLFNGRYELEAIPGSLTILARDMQQGDPTSVGTLSGGEKFMASLALALALSNMSGKVFSMDTIFIDEGFGSLSPGYLDNVMQTLNRLYDMGGRRVGIISHVEALKDRVPTQIKVARDAQDNTVSRVEVVG